MHANKQWPSFKSFVRTRFAWPGGYPLFAVMTDGEAICHTCAQDNYRLIVGATLRDDDRRSSWHVAGVDINYENSDLYCAHCGERIESAYCED